MQGPCFRLANGWLMSAICPSSPAKLWGVRGVSRGSVQAPSLCTSTQLHEHRRVVQCVAQTHLLQLCLKTSSRSQGCLAVHSCAVLQLEGSRGLPQLHQFSGFKCIGGKCFLRKGHNCSGPWVSIHNRASHLECMYPSHALVLVSPFYRWDWQGTWGLVPTSKAWGRAVVAVGQLPPSRIEIGTLMHQAGTSPPTPWCLG